MKKSTILSLATAGAIVATSAFTFAAWDQLDSTAIVGKLTIDKPVSVAVTEGSDKLTTASEHGENAPVYTGIAKVNVENVPDDYKLDATAVVYNGDDPVSSDDVTAVAVLDKDAVLTTSGEKTINVTVTPKDTTAAKNLAGQELNVKVTAKLVKEAPAS